WVQVRRKNRRAGFEGCQAPASDRPGWPPPSIPPVVPGTLEFPPPNERRASGGQFPPRTERNRTPGKHPRRSRPKDAAEQPRKPASPLFGPSLLLESWRSAPDGFRQNEHCAKSGLLLAP